MNKHWMYTESVDGHSAVAIDPYTSPIWPTGAYLVTMQAPEYTDQIIQPSLGDALALAIAWLEAQEHAALQADVSL